MTTRCVAMPGILMSPRSTLFGKLPQAACYTSRDETQLPGSRLASLSNGTTFGVDFTTLFTNTATRH